MEKVLGVIFAFIIILIFDLLLAYPAMLLWNWLMPSLFGLPLLTYWEMVGLQVLLTLLIPTSHNFN